MDIPAPLPLAWHQRLPTSALLMLEHYLRWFPPSRRLFELRRRLSRRLQARLEHAGLTKYQELPTLDGPTATADQFLEASRHYRHPVVLRGFMSQTKAVREWDMGYFERSCADSRYQVVADVRQEDPLTRKNETLTMSIGEFIASIRQGGCFRYLANATRILVDHPGLIRDLELPKLLRFLPGEISDDCFEAINFFMGGEGTGSDLHCAFAGNFFINVVGRKEWILLEPSCTSYLLPMLSRPFIYSDAYFDPGDEELGRLTRRLPSYRVVLEPGDVLFNGPWWWHRVRNRAPFTIGCAIRKSNIPADLSNNFLFTVMCIESRLWIAKHLFLLRKKFTREQRIFRDVLLEQLDHEINNAF